MTYEIIGDCIICGTTLDEWNREHGFCDECQAPVGELSFEQFMKGEEHARI